MRIFRDEYDKLVADNEEIHVIGPHGNVGGADPSWAACKADLMDVRWFSESWPSSAGISLFCTEEQYQLIRKFAKES